jgi:hypothetical protein
MARSSQFSGEVRDRAVRLVLTSDNSFEEEGKISGDEVMAAARIDRLPHHDPP